MPAAQLQRHAEAMLRAPVPHHRLRRGAVSCPVHAAPHPVDAAHQVRCACARILACGEQAHHQEGRLHDVAAVVPGREGHRPAGRAVHPVREGSAVARCTLQKAADLRYAHQCLAARDEAAFRPGDHRHDAEAGAARRHRVHHAGRAGTFTCHATHRMGEVGEIAQRLALHPVEQAVQRSHVTASDCTSRALGPTIRMKPPGSQPRVISPSAGPRS